MSRVLVTGANGFIGSNLCRWLGERGWQVDALVRESSDLRFLDGVDVRLVKGDLRSAVGIDIPPGTDYVVHTAALVSDTADDADCARNIVDATRGLVGKLRAAGTPLRRFVYVSTALVLGYGRSGISEERLGRSAFFLPYVRHKVRAESELRDLQAYGGFPLVILRPADVFGPNDRVSCARILAGCERGMPLVAGRGRWRFGYCHVDNFCRAVELALVTPDIEGRAYTVTNGALPTWREFFSAMQDGVGRKQRLYVPVAAARAMGIVSEAVRAVFPRFKGELNRYRVRRVTTETTYDISRTVAELGYRPDDDFRSQFAGILAWYRKEKARGGMDR